MSYLKNLNKNGINNVAPGSEIELQKRRSTAVGRRFGVRRLPSSARGSRAQASDSALCPRGAVGPRLRGSCQGQSGGWGHFACDRCIVLSQ